MIEEEVARVFRKNGWTWRLAGKEEIIPDEDDVSIALDEAARVLYDEPVGTQLEVGRLIIIKKHQGHDVFIFVGEYA